MEIREIRDVYNYLRGSLDTLQLRSSKIAGICHYLKNWLFVCQTRRSWSSPTHSATRPASWPPDPAYAPYTPQPSLSSAAAVAPATAS